MDLKKGNKKLPPDVAAIILKNLEKKAANPEAFKPKTGHAYSKDSGYMTCQPFKSKILEMRRLILYIVRHQMQLTASQRSS